MGIRPGASSLPSCSSILPIAHMGSDCPALVLGPWVPEGKWEGTPILGLHPPLSILGSLCSYQRDRTTSPSPPPPPKIALSHHVARAAPHQPQIPLKSNPHPAPSRMAPPPATAGLSAGQAPLMETRTVVLHSDRDNHKSPNNETGTGNTESDRVLIGWLLSRDALGTTAGLSFPASTLGWGSRMGSESLTGLFLASPISLPAR